MSDIKKETPAKPLKRKAEEDLEKVAEKSLVKSSNEVSTINQWWSKENLDEESDKKWEYMEHNGVLFPPFYKPHKIKINYKGEPVALIPQEEELATYWSQTIGSEWETKKIYRKNFSSQFLELIQKSHHHMKNFDDFDFTPIVKHLEQQKEIRKNKTPEEKKKEKDEKAKKDEKYGYCIVDGVLEKVGGYVIEPPTLFKGRGEHPKAGFMKARILPEDITINVARNAPVPKCDIPGHCWQNVLHDDEVTWLALYKDDTINKAYKYIFLAASSKFKGMNDLKKYEKARKLKDHIESIRADYRKKLADKKDMQNRQLGTATYLIDNLALRVGNEKSEEEADTVGCCSLRFEHIRIEDDSRITLDFLGKDSMRYLNTIKIDEIVWNNLKDFLKGKKEGDDLFDKINAGSLNEYLRSLMEGLTAKVFRTYNASITLEKELSKKNVNHLPLEEKVNYYDEANKEVAILCNHQKTIPKNFDIMLEKNNEKIDIMKEYLKELLSHEKKFAKNSTLTPTEETVTYGVIKPKEEKKEGEDPKKQPEEKPSVFIKKFPGTKEKTKSTIQKLEDGIDKEEKKLTKKEENKSIALGTSKINYNDPRITVTWCKNNEVPIEKVFQKALRTKFPWAMSCELDWKF